MSEAPRTLGPGRFDLPAELEPDGTWCVRFRVPAHVDYVKQLGGLLSLLTYSRNFARDAGHGAAIVSRTWQQALLEMPIEAGGECGELNFQLRDDPDDPCAVQQSLDGGETWSHAFNKDDCGGPTITPPPLPGNPEAADAAAGNALRNVYIGLLEMIGDCSITRQQFIEQATTYLRLGDPAFSNPVALGSLYDAWCALDPTEQETALDECTYSDEHSELASCYDNGGLIDDLNCLSETIGQWLDDSSTALMTALNQVVGALGLQGWQSFSNGSFSGGGGGAGGGGGFGSQCDWCHEFDLTSDDYASGNPVNITQYFGGYSAGVGYVSAPDNHIDIRFEFGGLYLITYQEIDYLTTASLHLDGEGFRINTQHGTWAGGPFSPYGQDALAHLIHQGDGTLGAGHTALATGFVQVQMYHGGPGTGVQTVTRWKVCGTGVDPFV